MSATLATLLLALSAQDEVRYRPEEVRGFTLQVQEDLDADAPGLRERTLEILDRKLGDLVAALPAASVERLREVPIWVSEGAGPAPCANYHPSAAWLAENGYDPRKAKAVEINNASVFVDWIDSQPSMVLHELAHAYHDQVLGYGHVGVAAAHAAATAGARLNAVRRMSGRVERHYALTNPMEWFAETTEALFGTNDYYPFVRGELLHHNREGARLVARLWGAPEPPPAPADMRRPEDEIVDLHRFFHDWFAGRLDDTDQAYARFADALAPAFRLTSPRGDTAEREALLAGLRRAHGAVAKEVEVDAVAARPVADGLWLVTYREWQRDPGAPGEPWTGRASSALLREDPAAPGGFLWEHVHETWLPEGTTR
ncbi:MAG: DUF4440 domain-containing protein [Planctomycetota bacterium]